MIGTIVFVGILAALFVALVFTARYQEQLRRELPLINHRLAEVGPKLEIYRAMIPGCIGPEVKIPFSQFTELEAEQNRLQERRDEIEFLLNLTSGFTEVRVDDSAWNSRFDLRFI